jgi:hypothetical protein
VTAPAPEQGQQPADQGQAKPAAKAAAPKVKPLDVIAYTHRDRILGGHHQAAGVVTDVRDGVVTVRPLAGHAVDVDPDDVDGVITADDV